MIQQNKSMLLQSQQLSSESPTKLKFASESIPNNIDLGFCAVGQIVTKQFTLINPSATEKQFSFNDSVFAFEPKAGFLPPKARINISLSYQPQDATVLVATMLLQVTGEPDRVIKISAIGKYPFIVVNTTKLDFESLIVGKQITKEIIIKNQSPVPALFQVSPIDEDSFRDNAFGLDYTQGVVPPKASFLIKVTFKPHIVDLISCSHFNITCPGGNSVKFECKGAASGVTVAFNNKSINFGEIKLGQQTSRLLILQNASDIPAQFQIFNDKKNIFSFSATTGVVNAHSTFRLIVQFNPATTMTYYERVFAIVRDHQVLYIDLMGTCYDLLIRPRPIIQKNVDVFRKRVISGRYDKEDLVNIKKINPQADRKERMLAVSSFGRGVGSYNPQSDSANELNSQASPSLKPKENVFDGQTQELGTESVELSDDHPSQVVLHKEMMLEVVSRNKLISSSTELLDFGFTEAFTLSVSLDIELTNNLSWRVSVFWSIPKERLDNGDEIAIFNIYPVSKVIKPSATERFSVTFRPHKNSYYFFQKLQYFATRYDPKHSDNLLVTKGKRADQLQRSLELSSSKIQNQSQGYLSQSLVFEDEIQPPICGSVSCVGHSFDSTSQSFIPILDIMPSNRIVFQPCTVGESVFASVYLVNKIDTPTYFRFSHDISKTFKCYPNGGLIEGRSFQIIIFEFSPTLAKPFSTTIACSLNHNLSDQLSFKLSGYSCEPKLEIQNEGQLFFPPSFSGVMARQNFAIQNQSRIPVEFNFTLPAKYENEIFIDPSHGILKPNELTYLKCSFIPYRKKNYKVTCPVTIRDVINLQQKLVGYFAPGSGSNQKERVRQEKEYKVQVFGIGGDGSLAMDPPMLDFGIVKVDFNNKQKVTLNNFSNIGFYVEIEIKPKDEKLANDHKLRTLISKSFHLDFKEGIVAGNSKLEIGVTFQPVEIFDFDLVMECNAKERNFKGASKTGKKIFEQKASIELKARGSYPQLKLVDVRNDSISVSTLWENFSINKINKELMSELTDFERKYNVIETLTIEEAASLQKKLKEYDFNFGYLANKKLIKPRKVVVTIQNIGGSDLDWRFKLPSDNQIELEPWADPGEPTAEAAFEKDMIERKIFSIEPKSGTLPAGEFKDIALYYSPSFEEKQAATPEKAGDNRAKATNEEHRLKVVFQVKNGKAVGLNLRGMTLAPLQGLLALRKTEYTLPNVPIGSLVPATMPIELVNVGSGKINYRVDLTSVDTEHNNESKTKSSSKIFDITKTDGILIPGEKAYLQCQFKPLEAKLYEFRIPIIVSDFIGEIQRIEMVIQGQGYNVRLPKESSTLKEEIPTQRSFVSSIGSKVFFSIEEIDFGELESQKPEYKLVLLYNAHEEKKLNFDFQYPKIACDDVFTIDPPSGEIEPKHFVQIKMTLIADEKPTFYEGELSCQITWESERVRILSEPKKNDSSTMRTVGEEDRELLFLRIKKKAKFIVSTKKFIPLESIVDPSPTKAHKHLFETIISQALNDIINDPTTDEMLMKRESLPLQLYGTLDEEEAPNEKTVSSGVDEKQVKPYYDHKDFRNMFFIDEFNEMVDTVMESTFFNLIQQTTLKEIDLLKTSKVFLAPK